MAFSNVYTFGFAAVVCVACSSALALVSLNLKDIQDANKRRDLYKNILESLDLPEKGDDGLRPALSGKEVDAMWADKVEILAISPDTGKAVEASMADLDKDGDFDEEDLSYAVAVVKNTDKPPEILGLFKRKDNGTVAIPMDGKGLWGPISAYIAFDPDLTTVQGATFFAPKETPGLGAVITDASWEANWLGKSIVDGGETVPIAVPKPSACDEANNPHCVDGVAGATLTSRGVDIMVAKTLALYQPYIQTVR